MNSWAYLSRTTHQRIEPSGFRFTYKLFYLFLDIDHVDAASAASRLLSYNRPNLFSFYDRDHGDYSGEPLRAWAESVFREGGIEIGGGRIMLLALPRVLGFVFNPLSVFFGYDPDGRLRGVLYAVRNTFGEAHVYVAPARDGGSSQTASKAFYVSPFLAVHGDYSFALHAPGDRLSLTVKNIVEGRVEHLASLTGVRTSITDWRLLAVFFGLPLMTLGVVAAIHWQALKLWVAGARYRRKPPAPDAALSPARLLIEPSGPAAI